MGSMQVRAIGFLAAEPEGTFLHGMTLIKFASSELVSCAKPG